MTGVADATRGMETDRHILTPTDRTMAVMALTIATRVTGSTEREACEEKKKWTSRGTVPAGAAWGRALGLLDS